MKTTLSILLAAGCCWLAGGRIARAGDAQATNLAPVRIGVYDSRALAYAWFWTEAHQRQLKELMQAARAAKAEGQTNRWQQLEATLRQHQDDVHRECFSTAPAPEALAAIQNRIPEIQKEADVIMLVSQWDEEKLRQYPNAEKVEMTDRLVQEFQPTEEQRKVIADLRKRNPLPLEKCNELIRQGKI